MSSLFSSGSKLPSKVNTVKYNKIPNMLKELNKAKLVVVKALKNTQSTYERRELTKTIKKLNSYMDNLDKLSHKYLIDKANKLINESGAFKRKTMKYIKRLQTKHSRSQKKSQKKKRKKVKTKQRRTKRN